MRMRKDGIWHAAVYIKVSAAVLRAIIDEEHHIFRTAGRRYNQKVIFVQSRLTETRHSARADHHRIVKHSHANSLIFFISGLNLD